MSGEETAARQLELQEAFQNELAAYVQAGVESGAVQLRGWDGPLPRVEVGLVVTMDWPEADAAAAELEGGAGE